MLPRLEAEESLLAAKRLAIGTGASLKPHDRRKLVGEWIDRADGADETSSGPRPASDSELQAIGIRVVNVPRRRKERKQP